MEIKVVLTKKIKKKIKQQDKEKKLSKIWNWNEFYIFIYAKHIISMNFVFFFHNKKACTFWLTKNTQY